MPRKVVEDSEFSFNVDTRLKMPHLTHVPSPPLGKSKHTPEKPPKRVDEEYVESELKKIEFFIENRMAGDAEESYEVLVKALHSASRALRDKYNFDLKRVETAIELTKL